jgi:Uma2 family endonuclease
MSDDRVTTDEYLEYPETRGPQELVFGVVRDAPAPAPLHQWAVGEIFTCLRLHLAKDDIGRAWMAPIDVVLDRERHLVVQPDVIVVLNARLHMVTDRVWGAPDLVIDVMSPHVRMGSLDERLEWFARYGVRECWLVKHLDPRIEVITFAQGLARPITYERADVVRSAVLPDLRITPGALLVSS